MKNNKCYIILIAGKAGSGKDTISDYLVEKYNFVKFAFADALKKHVSKKYKINKKLMYTQKGKKTVVNEDGLTVRDVLITEAMNVRGTDPDFWVDIVIENIENTIKNKDNVKIVISDFRFPNEYYKLYLKYSNIYTVEIIRPDISCINSINNIPETSLNTFQFDHIINNNSTLEDLYRSVKFELQFH